MQTWKKFVHLIIGSKLTLTWAEVNGAFRQTSRSITVQPAPAAKTTSATLTAAELEGGLITGNQGAAGAAAYTMPLATDLEGYLRKVYGNAGFDDSFDVSVINLSVVAAEDITMTTNTGWTLVGSMVVESNEATAQKGPSAAFRVRRTGANAFTLYRLA